MDDGVSLVVGGGAVGALAFSRETVTEVPAQQETVELAGIGVTVLLPDSWVGKYEVVQDSFLPSLQLRHVGVLREVCL